MNDYLVRTISEDGTVRALAAVTTATAALGRTLTAAGLLGATLEDGQTVMVRVLGAEELREILNEHGQVEVQCNFCARRYVLNAAQVEDLILARSGEAP